MAQSISLWGATYNNVPAIDLPKSTSGTARFIDPTPTTAVESDVTSGKIFFKANGDQATGTSSGGGGGMAAVGNAASQSFTSSSLTFNDLLGEPTSFTILCEATISPGTPARLVAVTYDGSSYVGQAITNTSNAQVSYISTGFGHTYSDGTLTVTSAGAEVQEETYYLTYSYGGSASNVSWKEAQVGSGATSITFTGLEDAPLYWACNFKSDFGTSSGYKRVIAVRYDGVMTSGIAMDSATNASAWWWEAVYDDGNNTLTITSYSTTEGGYFHQPGYYRLTYAIADGSLQSKIAVPSESQQVITADVGYSGLSRVTVEPIPSEYIVPSGTLSIESNGTGINVAQYAAVNVAVPTSGSSKNAQTAQSTNRATTTSYTELISLTCAKAGTYDVYWSTFRSSTSGTWGSQLYINDTAYGSAQTGSWSNHIQNIHLSNVTIGANADVAVRVRSRGSSYYGYVGTLTIIEA